MVALVARGLTAPTHPSVGTVCVGQQSSARAEAGMASVERIHEYSNALEQERNGKRVPAEEWPRQGTVQFKNVALRYRGGPLVLKGITASLAARERVQQNIVGPSREMWFEIVRAATLTLAHCRWLLCCGT